jgi:ATP-binding protein involved in chromosome partitioning
VDPRRVAIAARLEGVKRILAVTGGKGGIGKSMISSTLALVLSESGLRTGLLDLTGPSDHVFLGFDTRFPSEKFGIEPPAHHGIRCMSIAHFAGESPVPLRGEDVTNALIEIFAITRWGELDVLVIDMPPGLGDATLEALRLLRRAEFLVVATHSRVVLETVRKTLRFFMECRASVVGVLENMRREDSSAVEELARRFGTPFLGSLPFDETLEEATGDISRLGATPVVAALRQCMRVLCAGKGQPEVRTGDGIQDWPERLERFESDGGKPS